MRSKLSLLCPLSLSVLGLLLTATPFFAQDPQPRQSSTIGTHLRQNPQEGASRPIFGEITAIKDGTLELTRPDGNSMTVKITDKTEYRKDQQSAKLADFKVGDMVFIRAEGTADTGFTAMLVATRAGNGPSGPGRGGPGGQGGGMMMGGGELGKDFVFGEVKSVDAPKIIVLRPDNVTQTLELNEETSCAKAAKASPWRTSSLATT